MLWNVFVLTESQMAASILLSPAHEDRGSLARKGTPLGPLSQTLPLSLAGLDCPLTEFPPEFVPTHPSSLSPGLVVVEVQRGMGWSGVLEPLKFYSVAFFWVLG